MPERRATAAGGVAKGKRKGTRLGETGNCAGNQVSRDTCNATATCGYKLHVPRQQQQESQLEGLPVSVCVCARVCYVTNYLTD